MERECFRTFKKNVGKSENDRLANLKRLRNRFGEKKDKRSRRTKLRSVLQASCCLKRSDGCLPPTPVYFLEDSRRFYVLLSPVLLLLSLTVLHLTFFKNFKNCDNTQLTPDHIFSCTDIFVTIFMEKFKAAEDLTKHLSDCTQSTWNDHGQDITITIKMISGLKNSGFCLTTYPTTDLSAISKATSELQLGPLRPKSHGIDMEFQQGQ
ncbi:hypothetical protein LAZ67_19002274 [Cordylochernes scorpioides]|uniref:Uncharacterized protein n=1 Tax=Cordylochernes scorpioides TaxID=51811 RepID=A0ABY6LKZ9_9ARAC|nr:hypothetical protein LAZ67_19002274 [Cordylochernes scorpioides]